MTKPAPASLEVEAVTFIQRAAPNRNFVRFKPGILQSLAKSGAGSPVLRDHDQRSVLSRAGTVTKSAARHVDGEWQFEQTLRLVKPWAIEGVLDGTLDRFSIGWSPTGPVLCSTHGSEIFTDCHCWAGDEVDGEVVEWIFTSADLVEVSFVNVPAVTGTGPSEIREALCLGVAAGLTPHRAVAAHQWRSEAIVHRCTPPSSPPPGVTDAAALADYERRHAFWARAAYANGLDRAALAAQPVAPTPPAPRPATTLAAPAATTLAAMRPTTAAMPQTRTKIMHDTTTPEGRWASRYSTLPAHLRACIRSPRHLSMVHSMHGRFGDGSDYMLAAERFAANLGKGGRQ